MASGSIMAAVAVLLIHMERNAVTAKISITAVNRLPRDKAMTCKAIFLSSRWMCNALARAKPPKKTKITGSAKPASAAPVLILGILNTTASTGTSSAVIVMCTASVSHSKPTNNKIAKPLLALLS